ACGLICSTGFADCDQNAANGCEIDTRDNTANCGACGNACPSRANANATCSNSTYGFSCNAGFADCDGIAADGCETNLTSSPANCGSCGNLCTTSDPNATPTCESSQCGSTCNPGFTLCNGVCV